MRTSACEEIRAARALLSHEHERLTLPLGCQRKGKSTAQSVFVVLDEHGKLSATRGSGRFSYEDLIEEREWLVLLHYAERPPPTPATAGRDPIRDARDPTLMRRYLGAN